MKISRRSVVTSLIGSTLASPLQAVRPELPTGIQPDQGPFKGTRASLSGYQIPEWFRDAKFGIWAHWGPQSAIEDGDWYARNMYMQGSEQYDYHVETYGHPSKFGYKDTIPAWKAQDFQPAELIRLYKKAGAKYFFSMGVHHDNFDLWNSKYQSWNAARMGPKKDVVGLWREAARNEGLKFGVSEHLWITYKWFSTSHGYDESGPLEGVKYDGANPANFDLYVDSDAVYNKLDWTEDGIPQWWKRHWYMRIKDLVDNYQPDLLYSDGSLPFEDYGLNLVAHHYNLSAQKNGGKAETVYFSKRPQDSTEGIATLDVERGVVDSIWPRPFQTDTCIGDWHYKRGVHYKTPKTVVDLLVDIVSRNGNLLLNFPLPASGSLDLEERDVLAGITNWMSVNSEGIHGTRPWKIFGESPQQPVAEKSSSFNEKNRKDLTIEDIRFTTKGNVLYAFVMGWPKYQIEIKPLSTGTWLRVGNIQRVELLGQSEPLKFTQSDSGLKIMLPEKPPSDYAVAFKINGALS
ncbi:MAG TPA: alpha-L-fucosidase [Bryobacteraceae bacterium]|jgi:alpha-L-fucosidase|nr:alpha-L-fucosidase [Bryobacteraceae bacterium]